MVYKLLDTFLPLHAQFGIIFPFIIQKRCDLFVLPLLLSRKPPSGTRRFGNHLSLWLVILIQLKELRSFNNPPAHRPQTPACVWRPLKEPHLHVCWHICVPATGKTEANAVGSCLNYCSTKSTWQLAVFSMERSVFSPHPSCSKGCLHVSPVSESILIICL